MAKSPNSFNRMMGKIPIRSTKLAWLLLIVSSVVYGAEFLIFGDARGILTGLVSNLAFLPIYVLFVTLMIEKILKERERVAIWQKLNMVIGVFFSEIGTGLLRDLPICLSDAENLTSRLRINDSWSKKDYFDALRLVKEYDFQVICGPGHFPELRRFLIEKRGFMLGLLENPNLLEHDGFTDLLWAVFHLLEELEAREDFNDLPARDLDHLRGDMKRVFQNLTREWVYYMRHLKTDYPYLFSLAVRKNPLDPAAHVVLK